MIISAIVAMDEKRGIGKDNQLLFKIPADFTRMKQLTISHPIIMGRKTFESIGRVLPGRTNIIITRDPNYKVEEATVVHSLDEAFQTALISPNTSNPEVFIFGGGQIFEEALPKTDRLYITLVEGDFHADTFFPDYANFTKVIEKESHTDWEVPYTFLTLEKPS